MSHSTVRALLPVEVLLQAPFQVAYAIWETYGPSAKSLVQEALLLLSLPFLALVGTGLFLGVFAYREMFPRKTKEAPRVFRPELELEVIQTHLEITPALRLVAISLEATEVYPELPEVPDATPALVPYVETTHSPASEVFEVPTLPPDTQNPYVTETDEELIRRMRSEGASLRSIAATLGRSVSYVKARL